ncbi:isocitrate lyase/PEP mutase family protein [Calorimonas adulescens]|uniref:2-methylisocitrate lyase n=1 Tax=Calorimonas adulescens TaxID=2606906 RepID=A0A5D8QBI1_9THEO|nr:oxaloacetate decarboxylase [Calorimonas adulescens]TZE81509.1 oxaloacetate decarboxylase [Calorimonas adulescens]
MTKIERIRKRFVELLNGPGIIVMPGAPDALAAKIIEKTGFKAIFTTGYGTSATRLAKPDRGLVDFYEMVERAKEIVDSVDIPVFADADTGYGNPLNTMRTVRSFEDAGVAGIFLEDQVWPKRCGHMEGKQVIPTDEMVQKIRAAVDARRDKNFMIMSRTDARAVYDLDEAIERSHKYKEAGADLIFIEAPQSVEELKRIGEEFKGVPLMANIIEHGKTPLLTAQELQNLGFKLVVFPLTNLYAATYGMMGAMQELYEKGTTAGYIDRLVSFDKFNEFIGLEETNAIEARYK